MKVRLGDHDVAVAIHSTEEDGSPGELVHPLILPTDLIIPAGDSSATTSFTLTPRDDDVDETNEALSVTGTATGLTVSGATVTIVDDDERGVAVSEAALTVEEGGTAAYSIVLQSQPTAVVTVTPSFSVSSNISFSPVSLSFTAVNWSTARTVTVTAGADGDGLDETAPITHTVTGGDYQAFNAPGLTLTVPDQVGVQATDDVGGNSDGGRSVGGGGGGGPSGPTPSTVDFEWTVKHDLPSLDNANTAPTGVWSDGTILWVADNPDGAGDAVYAYDLKSGERLEDREFPLNERNRGAQPRATGHLVRPHDVLGLRQRP